MFFQTIKIAWRALLLNKTRSLLTMLGIIIGITAVIIGASTFLGQRAKRSKTMRRLRRTNCVGGSAQHAQGRRLAERNSPIDEKLLTQIGANKADKMAAT